MFDADSLNNWCIVGDILTITISDIILILLSSQENMKISFGLVEALLKYSEFFSKTQAMTAEQLYFGVLERDQLTVFDHYRNII